MSLDPLHDRLIVRVLPADGVTAGGVILPEQARDRPQRAKVAAVGPDVWRVVVGETVWFSQWAGTQVDHAGEELLFLREDEVVAVEVE